MRVPFSLVTKTKENGMISINVAWAIYIAAMSGCTDGGTCKVHFYNLLPFVADQSLRFEGFDTPERHRPQCAD
jgi:hypothetical protein